MLAAGKAANAELAASAKALAATEKAEAKAAAEVQKAAAKDAADEQAAHLKALAAIGRLYRAQASQDAHRAAAEAKAINAAALADSRATAAAQTAAAKSVAAERKAANAATAASLNASIDAAERAAAASAAAIKAQEEDIDNLVRSVKAAAKRVAADETEAYAIAAEAARAATDAQDAEFDRWVAASKAAALRVAKDETEAYAIVAAEAKKASDEQIAQAAKAAAAIKASAQAQKNSLAGGLSSAIGGKLKGIPGDIFGGIATSAKFATIGVLGLGAALAGVGLVSAAKQQAALVGFTALADQISATTDATTGLNVATEGLSQAQSKAIGKDFLQRLIDITNNSAIAQSAIQDTSQQLLALGFNGDQSIGIIKDVGNALAASGKSGGQLNEDLKGVITAFAQIKGSGRLLAQDLNQITTRIPSATRIKVYAELAKELGITGKTAKATNIQVQKMAKEGLIDADVAIAAITKVLENVPGAARDAVTGLDALGRQNLTLSGRFEALKDNIRSALAKAFLLPGEAGGGKSLADRLADQLGDFIPVITDAIAKVGPPLSQFILQFENFGAKVLPPLVGLIGKIFAGLGSALDSINTSLTGVTAKFASFGDVLSRVGFGPALLEAFKAIRDAIPPIIAAVGGIVVGLSPVLSIVADIARIVIAVLTPAFQGAALAFGAIGVALAPVAEAVRKLADEFVKLFGNDIVNKIGVVVGAFAGLTLAVAAADLAIKATTISMAKMSGTIVRFLLPALNLMAAALAEVVFFLAVNPIVLATLAIAALGVAFFEAWQHSQLFRDVVVDIAKVLLLLPVAPLLLLAQGFKLLFEGLAKIAPVVEFIGKVLTGVVLVVGVLSGVIPIIVGVIYAVRQLVAHFGDIAGAVQTAAGAIATAFGATIGFFETIGGVIADVASTIGGFFAGIASAVGGFFADIGGKIADIASAVGGFLSDIGGFFADMFAKLSVLSPVLDALSTAAGKVGDAFKFGFGVIIDTIDFLAAKIKALFQGLSRAAGFGGKLNPFHGLADDFQNAANAMDSVTSAAFGAVNQLDRVKGGLDAINGTAAVATVVIQTRVENPFSSSVNGELPGSITAEGTGDLASQSAAKANQQSAADELIANLKNQLAGLSSAGDAAGSAAAKTAKTKAENFRQAIKDLLASLDSEFKKSLVEGTRKQIDTALDALSKKIAEVFKAAGKKRPSGLIDDIQADNKKLKSLADQRDKIIDKLKAATDRFDAVSSQIKDFASVSSIDLASIGLAATDAKTKLADLSRLRIIKPGQDALNIITGGTAGTDAITAGSAKFAAALADRLKQIQDFQANVQKLIDEGVNKETIDQIISAGPEGGGTLAQSLAGASKSTVDAINATQKGIDDAAAKLGNTAADSLFRAGTQVVSGLIAGLKTDKAKIVAAMKDIADALVAEIKKALKIHSPSVRMAQEIGAHIVPGLLAPVHADGHGLVRDAMSSIADTMAAHAPSLAPVNLDALSGLANAEASLQLKAALAPSSVQLLAPPPPTAAQPTLGKDGVSAIVDALAGARASKEIHATTTQHFHGAQADPHAAAKALAKAVGGLR